MVIHYLSVYVLAFLMLTGCNNTSSRSSDSDSGQENTSTQSISKDLNVKQFKEKLEESPNALLVDVRTGQEVANGYIAGAKNIDFYAPDFKDQILKLDKEKPIFVYCASGGRSGQTKQMLNSNGFHEVYNLQGGFTAWSAAGYPVKK